MAPRATEPPTKRRRRRKVARTENFSSDSSDASDSNDSSSSDSDDSEDNTLSKSPRKETKTSGTQNTIDSSINESIDATADDLLEGKDVKMTLEITDSAVANLDWDSKNFGDSDDETSLNSNPKTKIEKATKGDSDTLDPDVKDNKEEFMEYYLGLMTGGSFGDDINKVRESNDFGDGKASMPLLISALKIGYNMFDEDQRHLLLSTRNQK